MVYGKFLIPNAGLQKKQQQQDEAAAAASSKKKKVTPAQLRTQKGTQPISLPILRANAK
ncbi:hypothetical protein PtrM4_018660 [Pyrenophora tritici-repentis]|uniref:Uncharacterized protein n=1 Tax=Pyrenophora tritici-repentis TaxID=45151 RepID=A0A834VUW8_9PLEO|nr:hypothetical protein PtrM4_018660 [Pyrenophora tritici-repentis]